MRPFRNEDLAELLAEHESPCVSVYMPTHRCYPGTEQDPILYKDLVKSVESILAKKYKEREVAGILEKLRDLDREEFWKYQRDGLAVFCSPDYFSYFRLPMEMPQLEVVADTFHTKPLIKLLQTNASYYVLLVSQSFVSLYEGWRDTLDEIDIRGVPESLQKAFGLTSEDLSARRPVVRGAGFGKQIPYGKELSKEAEVHLEKYFRAIDRALWEYLRDDPKPLILAAHHHHHPVYHRVSKYPELLDEGIDCDPERCDKDELRERAWKIIEPRLQKRMEDACEAYKAAASHGRGSGDLEEVAQSAVYGRVKTLLLEEDKRIWGRLDRTSGAITWGEEHKNPEDADILDDLAEEVLLRGGTVFLVPPGKMPTTTGLAAIYRY